MSIKNTAVLSKLTYLKAKTANVTRWSSMKKMISRFVEVRPELIEAIDNEESEIRMDRTNGFRNRAQKYFSILEAIDIMTKKLQTRTMTLDKSRRFLDTLDIMVIRGRIVQIATFIARSFSQLAVV